MKFSAFGKKITCTIKQLRSAHVYAIFPETQYCDSHITETDKSTSIQ